MVGCKQGEGTRCEVTSDCDDGLTCVMNGQSSSICTADPGRAAPVDAAAPQPLRDGPMMVDSGPRLDATSVPDVSPDLPGERSAVDAPPDLVTPDAATDARAATDVTAN